MRQTRLSDLEIFRQSDHGLAGIPFGKSREEVRISDTEMAFNPIIRPGQAENLNRPRAGGGIGVAVKPPMENHISRLDPQASPKAGFYKGAGQDNTRITLPMTVAGWRGASRKYLDPSMLHHRRYTTVGWSLPRDHRVYWLKSGQQNPHQKMPARE